MATNADYNSDRKFEIMTGEEFLKYKKYWPVTYIMKSTNKNGDRDKIYIGITKDFDSRMKQHDSDPIKRKMKERWVISHSKANESISYYLESFLIHYGRMNKGIQNINTKIQSGELYKKDHFYNSDEATIDSRNIYDELVKKGIFNSGFNDLVGHQFDKLNPDLGFSDMQMKIVNRSIEFINDGKNFHINGPAGTGKTAILIKIINDYTILNDGNDNSKILCVYSASVQNRKTIKEYIRLIGNKKVKFFESLNSFDRWQEKNVDLKDRTHLLVDEAQSLSQGTYNEKKIHMVYKCKSELEWIRKNTKSFNLIFDPIQTDYSSDIDILNEIKDDEMVMELGEQFRISADPKFFNFFKEFLGIKRNSKYIFERYNYEIIPVETLEEGLSKIKLLNEVDKEAESKILTAYNTEYINYMRAMGYEYDNSDKTRDVLKLPLEKIQNSKRTKGLSLGNSLVIIPEEIKLADNKIVIDTSKWESNVLQDRKNISYQEKIIRNTYYILMTRATSNLIVYIEDDKLRERFKWMVKNRTIKKTLEDKLFKKKIV